MEQRLNMEHAEVYTLMMETLDGELAEGQRTEMDIHLQSCPSCAQEWQMIQAVHELLQQAPILSPAADFTQRTMALLPNTRYRMYTMGAIYGLLLLVGFVPLAVVVWFGVQFIPALGQPVLVQGMLQAGGQVLSLIQAVIGAFWQGFGNLGEILGQQPSLLGWSLVLIGVVFLWGGLYSQLTRQQRI